MNIESEILKNEWHLIGNIFEKAQEKYNCCSEKNATDEFEKYEEVIEFLIQEYEKIYPKFVLEPYKENVINLFNSIQTKEFEKQKNISNEITKFQVFYYLCQYFYIFVLPILEENIEYEDQPRFEINTKDENIKLFKIFNEIWWELNKENESSEFELLEDFELLEFYEIQVKLLTEFLSECWLKTKEETNSNVIAIMSESTGVGKNYLLDEKRVLTDNEMEQLCK